MGRCIKRVLLKSVDPEEAVSSDFQSLRLYSQPSL